MHSAGYLTLRFKTTYEFIRAKHRNVSALKIFDIARYYAIQVFYRTGGYNLNSIFKIFMTGS
jgi:hypothetical protein